MNIRLITEIQEKIDDSIASVTSVGGGDIASSYKIITSTGRTVFGKILDTPTDAFHKEANGLQAIKRTNTIKSPHVIGVGEKYLLLEFIDRSHSVSDDSHYKFGTELGKMHKVHSPLFGLDEDNYIGHTIQKNMPRHISWCDFYWNNRLSYQLYLAEKSDVATKELSQLMAQLENRISDIIENNEPPSLIHGDLWSGNYLFDKKQNAVLIDPALYYGHREIEIAMTTLFGGFSSDFYQGYNDEYPLQAGHERREGIYQLYHLLNHLNLFGRGYLAQCIGTIKEYL